MGGKNTRKNKNKNSATHADSLQWALRKRGIRPSGTIQQMEKKLAELRQAEEQDRARKMQEKQKQEELLAQAHQSRKSSENGSTAGEPVKQQPRKRCPSGGSPSEIVERKEVVLWKRPIQTVNYFVKEIPCTITDGWQRFFYSLYDSKKRAIPNTRKILLGIALLLMTYTLHFAFCRDDPDAKHAREQISWFGYWVILGILSSVGLGTGLHTFVLYLGPFIAKVALAAQECRSLQFPKPPYPDQIICPEDGNDEETYSAIVSVFDIMAKVRWEALFWGFGTALGELPPFFMARAARVSGMVDDENLEEFTELLQAKKQADPKNLTIVERGKLFMEELVEKVGFWGILVCASVPNPLFDLAGITCGHFLVPFTTFFGATVIGKAVIKAHIQMAFVIIAFNEDLLETVVSWIGNIPKYGSHISEPFVDFMNRQKANLHNKKSSDPGFLGMLLDKLVLLIVIYFVISIVNSMAQSYHKRVCKLRRMNGGNKPHKS